jgi:acetyl esterase
VRLHPQARALLDVIESFGDPPLEEQTPEQARQLRRAKIGPSVTVVHEIRDVDAGGVPARLYRPSDEPGLGVLVYLHGGGWVIGDLESHDELCRQLCVRSGQAVLSVDYRLAPEYPFPAGLADSIQATRWAHANAATLGADPDRIAIGGDSAGANLAAVVSQLAPAPLVFQLLVYPAVDARLGHPSVEENATGYFLTAAGMRWFIDHYLAGGEGSPDDPRVSPLLAAREALAASPPTLVITAGFDPLRDEGRAYADALADAGVPTSLVQFDGMFHAFVSLGAFLDDGRAALALAAEYLRTHLAPP